MEERSRRKQDKGSLVSHVCMKRMVQARDHPTLVLHPEADLSPCLQLHKPPHALLYSLSLSVLDELIP